MDGDIGGGSKEDDRVHGGRGEMLCGQSCCFMHRVLHTMMFAQYRRSDAGVNSRAHLQRTQWWGLSDAALLRLKKNGNEVSTTALPSSVPTAPSWRANANTSTKSMPPRRVNRLNQGRSNGESPPGRADWESSPLPLPRRVRVGSC
jgi:hypothetical protein